MEWPKPLFIIFFAFAHGLPLSSFTQATKRGSNYKTSEIISIVSGEWKSDSVGSNGYRASVFEAVRYSKIDNVQKQFLWDKLGTPVRIQKFYSGTANKNYVGYRYYTFNLNDYPRNKPFVGGFIEFVFDEGEINLQYIEDGDLCL